MAFALNTPPHTMQLPAAGLCAGFGLGAASIRMCKQFLHLLPSLHSPSVYKGDACPWAIWLLSMH
eukprot:698278-Amphidinium_carterae.1